MFVLCLSQPTSGTAIRTCLRPGFQKPLHSQGKRTFCGRRRRNLRRSPSHSPVEAGCGTPRFRCVVSLRSDEAREHFMSWIVSAGGEGPSISQDQRVHEAFLEPYNSKSAQRGGE